VQEQRGMGLLHLEDGILSLMWRDPPDAAFGASLDERAQAAKLWIEQYFAINRRPNL
jgi:hypothetical protein